MLRFCRDTSLGCLLIALFSALSGCDVPVTNIRPVGKLPLRPALTHEDLDATLWMQTSAEYAVITQQIYESAWRHVDSVLRDKHYAAWPTQPSVFSPGPQGTQSPSGDDSPRPPAVILDVDETVLDNSAYQAQRIREGGEFDADQWHAFCQRAESTAVPGAIAFIHRCWAAEIDVFFVTNRDVKERQATCDNLRKLNILRDTDQQHVMCKGERAGWTSDKESRRKHLAESHRVLAMVGDDLNDFVSVGYRASPDERKRLAMDYASMWGTGWFMLPNADYGGWERALFEWNDAMPRSQKLRRKFEALR